MKLKALILVLVCWSTGAGLAADPESSLVTAKPSAVPVIYCTDLFHPHDDPDDHFDLATLYAMPELNIKGIVLDQGAKQRQRPGRIPVSQLNELTGRNVPPAIGLANPLKSPTDQGLDQKPEFQQGVSLILDILKASPTQVRIAAVGSVRDIVAAFNREPGLFRRQVAMMLVFIGEASEPSFREYNVALDPQAYIGLMRSGLPIYWVPCFDGGLGKNQRHASFWQAKHETLLQEVRPELVQYFIYALEKEKSDSLAFLQKPVDTQRRTKLFAETRNLWCTAIFGVMSGRVIVFDGTKYVSILPGATEARDRTRVNEPFAFRMVELSINDGAVIQYGKREGSQKVMQFEIRNPKKYAEAMTSATAGLLATLGK